MARSRSLKPGFFTNEVLAEIAPLGRILFQGLWCLADREGRLEDRPRKIKAEILPYDDCDVESLLNELNKRYFITRYAVNGARFIQINAFAKHQNPHIKEAESVIPGPEQSEHSTGKSGASTGKSGASSGNSGASPADSLLLVTDSLLKDSCASPDGERVSALPLDEQKRFARFWDAYPRKRSKGQAERAWKKIRPDDLLLARMLKGLEAAKKSQDWCRDMGKFIPYPASWLNASGWEDEYTPVSQALRMDWDMEIEHATN